MGAPRQNADGALRSLRERNRSDVIDVLRRARVASRADIARLTGLSRTTVSSLVTELQDSGLVTEAEVEVAGGAATPGRPGVLLALEPAAGTAVGVDFGHSHLRVAIADLSSRVLAERLRAHDVDRDAGAGLDAAAELIDEVLEESGISRDRVLAVGMGLPGPVDRHTGTVGSSVILPGWAGLRPASELEQRIGLPIKVDNDANLGALGELSSGAAVGAQDLVYVKIASGIGSALVLGGRVHHGASGIAGELGHVIVDPQGHVCRCGNRGCLETLAAGPALLDLLRHSHGDLDTAGLLDLVADGDVGSRRVITDAGRSVGRVLADVVNLVNPELIVIGGELGVAGDALIEGVTESIRRYALPAASEAVRVRAAVLGDRAEVLGALALVINDTDRLRSAHLSAL
jgi:predicted NBD/HSP70 family sugar kinase